MTRQYSILDVRLHDTKNLGAPDGTERGNFTGNEVLRLRLIKWEVLSGKLVDGCNCRGVEQPTALSDAVDMTSEAPKEARVEHDYAVCLACGIVPDEKTPEDDADYAHIKTYGYCTLCAHHLYTCKKKVCPDCEGIAQAFSQHIFDMKTERAR